MERLNHLPQVTQLLSSSADRGGHSRSAHLSQKGWLTFPELRQHFHRGSPQGRLGSCVCPAQGVLQPQAAPPPTCSSFPALQARSPSSVPTSNAS